MFPQDFGYAAGSCGNFYYTHRQKSRDLPLLAQNGRIDYTV